MVLITGLLTLSALCAQCGPAVHPITTKAIIRVESGGNPYAIGDNTTRHSYSPKSKQEAIEIAQGLLSQGHSLDLGIMQINSCHIKTMGLSLDDLFDPCRNINTGTKILSEAYRNNDRGEARNVVLFKALSAYNTGSAWRGPAYINKILRAAGAPYRVAVLNAPPTKTHRKLKTDATSLTAQNQSIFFQDTYSKSNGENLQKTGSKSKDMYLEKTF